MPSTYDATTKVGFTRPTMQEYEEHSRGGDASTGRPLKYTQDVPNKVLLDTSSSSTVYVGEAVPNSATSSALWRVYKVAVGATSTAVTFADGNDDFDNIWDDRSSLTYS